MPFLPFTPSIPALHQYSWIIKIVPGASEALLVGSVCVYFHVALYFSSKPKFSCGVLQNHVTVDSISLCAIAKLVVSPKVYHLTSCIFWLRSASLLVFSSTIFLFSSTSLSFFTSKHSEAMPIACPMAQTALWALIYSSETVLLWVFVALQTSPEVSNRRGHHSWEFHSDTVWLWLVGSQCDLLSCR